MMCAVVMRDSKTADSKTEKGITNEQYDDINIINNMRLVQFQRYAIYYINIIILI